MCGFAGVVARRERYRTTRETLAAMAAAIAHRGPDGEAFFCNHESEITPERPQCAMAFRRLAVLDPDPRAMQPFTIGTKTLVFNGEIYNFRELRQELTLLRPEYQWRTSGDTEVLAMAYQAWGSGCVERLNGMFAFGVWDDADGSLFLARDRMGQKPLYYIPGENRMAFASELGALRPLSFWDEVSNIDDSSLVDYLNLGYVTGNRTMYGGVRKLPPSTWLCDVQASYFDRLAPERDSASGDQPATVGATRSAERTRSLVRLAVERQLVSDVPLGVFLSGGIDSSVIAACARRSGPMETFSIGFDDPRYDETAFAQRVADHLGTQHHTFRLKPDAAEALPLIARSFGEPMADSSAIPTHYLARETRQHVTVALSGDGGDELFGGYDRYRALAMTERLPESMRKLLKRAAPLLPARHPKSSLSRIRRLLTDLDRPPAVRYARYTALFDRPMIDALRGRPVADEQWAGDHEWPEMGFEAIQQGCRLDAVQTAAAMDRIGYLPDDLLTKVDRCTMLYALEVRSPFMDHDVVSYAAGLTTEQLVGGGPKRMLREAFAHELPDFVFRRRKMGFAVPVGDWFRGELRAMLHDTLTAADGFCRRHFDMTVVERLLDDHSRRRVDHAHRLYALLMLELWWKNESVVEERIS